jgi:integrase
MSLYKRGNVWWSKLPRNGRPWYQSTGIKVETPGADPAVLKSEAQRKDDAWRGEIATGTFLVRQDQVTYDALVEDLLRHYENTGDRDLREVRGRLAHLTPFFGGARAVQIDAATIARYVAKRKKAGASAGTVNRELGMLSRLFTLATENRRVLQAPPIRRLKEAPPRAGFFEADQYEAVRRLLPDDLQLAVTLAHTYGWRTQSEVLTLERRQLDLDAGTAGTIRLDAGSTKNDDGRVVYITPELKGLLRAHLERVKALEKKIGRIIRYVFPHFSGVLVKTPRRPVLGERRQDFRRAWATACRRAGCPGMLRHDFRRTAVRNLVDAGVSERVAMTITGHKTRSVFDRYHIVAPADLQEASVKLSQKR